MNHFIQNYFQCFSNTFPEISALRWCDENAVIHNLSYSQLAQEVQKFAGYLNAVHPDLKGKHIAFCAPNSPQYLIGILGVLYVGGVACLLNPQETAPVLKRELETADADLLFTEEAIAPLFTGSFPADRTFLINAYTSHKATSFMAASAAVDSPDATALFLFTSGTSGMSKCVPISHRNLSGVLDYGKQLTDAVSQHLHTAHYSLLLFTPFFHSASIATLFILLNTGLTIDLCLQPRYLYRDLALLGSEVSLVVPMFAAMMYKDLTKQRRERLGKIRFLVSGGALPNPEHVKTFIENGIGFVQSYGLTETTAFGIFNNATMNGHYDALGMVGKGFSIRFIAGEICLKSALNTSGYYKAPEETALLLDSEGWLHTGDLGYMDEEGYVYLTGRKKNLIILSSGENVSPEELENLLAANEAVKEVVVKEKNGKICAEIFCEPDCQAALREFVDEVNRGLPLYKRMTLVEFRDTPFERTATGKIKRS